MPRIYLASHELEGNSPEVGRSELASGDRVLRIRGEQAKRLSRVLRLKPGETFEVVDERGTKYEVIAECVSCGEVSGRVHATRSVETDPRLKLTVLQGMPKGRKMDLIIQKSAELGVSNLIPVMTERSVPRAGLAESVARRERWRKISIQATEQSGRGSVMGVHPAMAFAEAVAAVPEASLRILLYEGAMTPLREALGAAKGTPGLGNAALLVGPEGGLTFDEVGIAQSHGYMPVSLGPRILRTETVALVVAGILFYAFGDL